MVIVGFLNIVMDQPCFAESVYSFRNWFPNAGKSVCILMFSFASFTLLTTCFPMPERSEL